jgi:hypothetical protein
VYYVIIDILHYLEIVRCDEAYGGVASKPIVLFYIPDGKLKPSPSVAAAAAAAAAASTASSGSK